MFTLFYNFFNNNTNNINNINNINYPKKKYIHIEADGKFDQELLHSMLKYANDNRITGNHTLVMENFTIKLKLNL